MIPTPSTIGPSTTVTAPTGGSLQGALPLLGEHVRGLWRHPVLRQRRRPRPQPYNPYPNSDPNPNANTNPSRSLSPSPSRSRCPNPNQVVDGVVARHRFVRAEALLSWGRATSSAGHVYAPNLRIQFTENTVVEGNHLWNWNGSCPVTAASNRARVL